MTDIMSMDSGLIGPAIEIGVLLVGGLGTFITVKVMTNENTKKVAELTARSEKSEERLDEFRLTVSDNYVKKNDQRDLEERLGKRLDTVEHNIRGMVMDVIGAIRGGGPPRTGRRLREDEV